MSGAATTLKSFEEVWDLYSQHGLTFGVGTLFSLPRNACNLASVRLVDGRQLGGFQGRDNHVSQTI